MIRKIFSKIDYLRLKLLFEIKTVVQKYVPGDEYKRRHEMWLSIHQPFELRHHKNNNYRWNDTAFGSCATICVANGYGSETLMPHPRHMA